MGIRKEEALEYHSEGRKGKIEVTATKPCFTSRDLSLAYTPGVAEPCREIYKNQDDVFKYTAKGNLVAVVSNGTAVLGLGDIGPHAGKPVMEGKAVLFKRFADIDVFDIELNSHDPEEIIKAVQLLEPTFGGINLEDIKAPECFDIEERLKETMNIPVFHDDQHGTAIISCAALINAAEITGKKLEDMTMVVSGAGAAAVACCNIYMNAGIRRENIRMFDSKGIIHKGRTDLNKFKEMFANDYYCESLEEGMKGSDIFIGLSKADILSAEMVKSMNSDPIIFAMANPDPEIKYEVAIAARKDILMATGRSDYPNQVNNVLGFPFIFRGALDVRARAINDEMKMAAVKALAELAKEKVPDVVINAYGGAEFSFGRNYIIPKPFDPRVLWKVAPAVARAAIETGVAREPIEDWYAYEESLKERLGFSQEIIRVMIHKAKLSPKKIVYPEGEEEKIIRAANSIVSDRIGNPVLLGNREIILQKINELGYNPERFEIIDPKQSEKAKDYAKVFYEMRSRKGMTPQAAERFMNNINFYGSMMVHTGDAHALIGGLTMHYPETIRPALQCIGRQPGFTIASGLYIVLINRRTLFFADTTVNINPTMEQLAEIAIQSADMVKQFEITPRVAMLSFSNFGSVSHEEAFKMKKATELVKKFRPDIIVDGEMQADTALMQTVAEGSYPMSSIQGDANVLIFPNLSAGNIAYKLMQRLTNATVIGPILTGLRKPVHVLQRGCSVDDIINMSAIAVVEATENSKNYV